MNTEELTPEELPAAERESIPNRQREFLKEVKRLPMPKLGDPERRRAVARVVHLCKREVRELKAAGYSITTIAKSLTLYRNEIRDLLKGDQEKFVLRHLNLSMEQWQSLRLKYQAKVTEDLKSRRPIKLKRVREMVKIANEQLHANSYIKQAAALVMVTGRRPIEILKTAEFAAVPKRQDQVLFSGQAKKHNDYVMPAYPIPTLAPALEVIAALNELRSKKDFSELSTDEVNKKTAKELGLASLGLFGADSNGVKVTPKDLRAIYGKYCFHTLCPPEMGETVYAASIYGHESHNQLDRKIADSYNDFYFDGREEEEGEQLSDPDETAEAEDEDDRPSIRP